MSRTVLLLLALLVAGGCRSGGKDRAAAPTGLQTVATTELGRYICAPQRDRVPCTRGARAQIGYQFVLETHCGIRFAYFDGRLWEAVRPRPDRSGNPPPGWGNPFQRGSMRLVAPTRAEFRAGRLTASFRPARRGHRPDRCE